MSYTIIFQREDFAGRKRGQLATFTRGVVEQPSHYCVVVSDETYDRMRYDIDVTSEVDEEGSPIVDKSEKNSTYILDVDRAIKEYPDIRNKTVYTDDVSIVTEVPLG